MKKLVVAALVLLAPIGANAIPITSSVGVYDVTYVEVLGTDPTLASQPWWGSESLATEFASLVNDDLGILNDGVFGPLFAYSVGGGITNVAVYFLGVGTVTGNLDSRIRTNYAVATKAPEPGTLTLLSAGLLGLVALRRRRIS